MRRLSSLFVIWLGLLSVAVPAMACANSSRNADCCPAGVPAPCGECPSKGAPPVNRSSAHCAPAPVQAGAPTAVANYELVFQDVQPSPPAFPAMLGYFASNILAAQFHAARQSDDNATFSSQSPAYLVTGRLRL